MVDTHWPPALHVEAALQTAQVAPLKPQATASFVVTHVPLAEQQPLAQLVGVHVLVVVLGHPVTVSATAAARHNFRIDDFMSVISLVR
jgi:hypothetical protein